MDLKYLQNSIEEVYGSYTNKVQLIQRFNTLHQQRLGRLSFKKLQNIWEQLCQEKLVVDKNIDNLREQANRLVGTGMNGIEAQVNLDMTYKMEETYRDYQFDKLRSCIGKAIYNKKNKLKYKISVGRGTAIDYNTVKIIEDVLESIFNKPLDTFSIVLKNLSTQIPTVEISATDINKIWNKSEY